MIFADGEFKIILFNQTIQFSKNIIYVEKKYQ